MKLKGVFLYDKSIVNRRISNISIVTEQTNTFFKKKFKQLFNRQKFQKRTAGNAVFLSSSLSNHYRETCPCIFATRKSKIGV